MSRKFYTEVFWSGSLMTTALVIVIAVLSTGSKDETDQPPPAKPASRARFKAPDSVSWPTARGDRALTGFADPLPSSIERVWAARLNGPIRSAAVLGGKRAFVGCADGGVYCLELDDGRIEWRFDAGGPVEAAPLLAGDLFIGTADGDFISIDPATGNEKWRARPGCKITGHANFFERGKTRAIVFGGHDSALHCLDAATGETVWTLEVGGYVNGGPAVADGFVFFGSCDGLLYAAGFDGVIAGTADAGSYVPGSVACSEGMLYACHFDNGITCARAPGMRIVWRFTTKDKDSPFFSSPAVHGGRVVAGSRDGYVHCVSASEGQPLWQAACGSAVDSSPVICGDTVIAATREGRLLLLDLDDGSTRWSFEAGGGFSASPAAGGGMFLIGSEDAVVHAFGRAGG